MAGLFALSVDPAVYCQKNNLTEDLFWGTFYHQHLGEQYGGFSVLCDSRIKTKVFPGLLRPNFEGNMSDLEGTEGIGYCGSVKEPFEANSKFGKTALCFSGNIVNSSELVRSFMSNGYIFNREDDLDIELIVNLLAQEETIIKGVRVMITEVKGAFALLILTQNGIYAALSSGGYWPLVIGRKLGAVAIASETTGFSNRGFKIIRYLNPGELVRIKNGQIKSEFSLISTDVQVCKFLWVYTAFPNAVIHGIPASLVRKRLGANLALNDIKEGFIPDVVSYVPDSGRCHGIGYHQEFCRQINEGRIKKIPLLDEVLFKYPYTGRSYTPQTQKQRDLEADIKILASAESYKGKVLVICDDSIVRGTQIKANLAPKLKTLGFKEIHVRASNPELLSHCPWGKTTKKGETLAGRIQDLKERTEFLGVDSLKYNSIDDLVEIIGLPRKNLCVDCALKP